MNMAPQELVRAGESRGDAEYPCAEMEEDCTEQKWCGQEIQTAKSKREDCPLGEEIGEWLSCLLFICLTDKAPYCKHSVYK